MEENVIETAETVVEETAAPAPVEAAAPAQEQQPAREAREPRETRERPAKRNFKKQSRKVCIFCQEKAAKIDYKDVAKLRKFIAEGGKRNPPRGILFFAKIFLLRKNLSASFKRQVWRKLSEPAQGNPARLISFLCSRISFACAKKS